MASFRDDQLLKSYPLLSYIPDGGTPVLPGANLDQPVLDEMVFTVDTTNESRPLDWYNAYFSIHTEIQYKTIQGDVAGARVKDPVLTAEAGGEVPVAIGNDNNGGNDNWDNVADAINSGTFAVTLAGGDCLIEHMVVRFDDRVVVDINETDRVINAKNKILSTRAYQECFGDSLLLRPVDEDQANAEDGEEPDVAGVAAGATAADSVARQYLPTHEGAMNSIWAVNDTDFAIRKGDFVRTALGKCNGHMMYPLNRIGFFYSFVDQIAPNGKVVIRVRFTRQDKLLMYPQFGNNNGGANNHMINRVPGADDSARYRYVIKDCRLVIPRLDFNAEGQKFFLSNYLHERKWTYMRETFKSARGDSRAGSIILTGGVVRPRHVFVWISPETESEVRVVQRNNVAVKNTQTNKYFASTARFKLSRAQIEVENGHMVPVRALDLVNRPQDAYRELQRYNWAFNDKLSGPLIDQKAFQDNHCYLYFDLRQQEESLKAGTTRLTFHYTMETAADAPYDTFYVYAIILGEEILAVDVAGSKVVIKN